MIIRESYYYSICYTHVLFTSQTLWPFPLHRGHGFLRILYRQQTVRRNSPCPQPNDTPENQLKPSHGGACMPRNATNANRDRPNALSKPSTKPSMTWACPTTSSPRSKAACEPKSSCSVKSSASCSPPFSAVAVPRS